MCFFNVSKILIVLAPVTGLKKGLKITQNYLLKLHHQQYIPNQASNNYNTHDNHNNHDTQN